MSRRVVNDEYIYCYKCGTKNDKNNKKCCNRECKTKLHDKDHVYIDYFTQKWHEYLEDLGKDSVVSALTLFFNYILYGTVLSISVIAIASGIIDTIIDKATGEEVVGITEYNNVYDSDYLINGCWYSEAHDDYWIIANEKFRLKDGKKSKLNYAFMKIEDKKLLTMTFDDVITTGEYNWSGKDNFTFYFDNFDAASGEYKRIKCSDVPGEKVEEPVIDVKPETTTTTTKVTTVKTTTDKSTMRTSVNNSTTPSKRTTASATTTTEKKYLFSSSFDSKTECQKKFDEVRNDYCSKEFPGAVDNPKFVGFDCSVISPSNCKESTVNGVNKYLLTIDYISDCNPVYIN